MEATNKTKMIPFIVYESMLDKEDRQQRRMVIAIVLLVVLLFGSNAVWLYHWSRHFYVDDAYVETDNDGGNANIDNGESDNAEEVEEEL